MITEIKDLIFRSRQEHENCTWYSKDKLQNIFYCGQHVTVLTENGK